MTITSWKDGIVSGRLEMKTSRGVALDTTFRAWFEDATGALARAAALPAPR